MYNIDLDEIKLEELIKKLETNNKSIVEHMDSIYSIMTEINNKDWCAPEKERINNNFIPYIKEAENKTEAGLNAKVEILKSALNAYRKRNEQLTNAADKLEVLK